MTYHYSQIFSWFSCIGCKSWAGGAPYLDGTTKIWLKFSLVLLKQTFPSKHWFKQSYWRHMQASNGGKDRNIVFFPTMYFFGTISYFSFFFSFKQYQENVFVFFPKVRFFCSCFIVMCHLLSAYEEMLSVILQAVFTSQLIYCRFISGSEARPGSPSGCGRARSSSCRPARVFVVFPPHGWWASAGRDPGNLHVSLMLRITLWRR